MPKEHDDLIEAAKAAPDIETALEGTFHALAGKWRDVASRNDFGKGAAMSAHMSSDVGELVTAILGHPRVFKPEPGKPAPTRASLLTGTPKAAVKPSDQQPGESNEDFAKRMPKEPVRFPGESDAAFSQRVGTKV